MNEIATNISSGKGTAGALVNDKSMYDQATGAITALREDAEALKHNFLLRGFFNRRGYESSADIARYELPKVPQGGTERTFVFESKQLFEKAGSAKLKNENVLKDAGR
jgi:hypothetical protein